MKLTPEMTEELARTADAQSVGEVINDACELLTMRVVLMLKKRAGEIMKRMREMPPGSSERNDLAQQVNALRRFTVELSEAA